MKTFRVLCYRPDWDGHILDNAITGYSQLVNSIQHWRYRDILSLLKCGHTEIWTPNENGELYGDGDPSRKYLGLCWTSTMRGKTSGACVRPAYEVLDHPHRWYYYEIEVSDNGYTAMVTWMQGQVACNKRYDILDIFKFFLPIRKQDVNDCQKICSGFTSIAVWIAGDCTTIESVAGRYTSNWDVDDLVSPLLLSFRFWCLGGKPIDLKTGKVLV